MSARPGVPLPWSWRVTPLGDLAATLVDVLAPGRPGVVAVDGHSSSGKSTLAPRLVAALGRGGVRAAVLHTDDLAWHHGVFAWDALLRDEVLPVVAAGRALDYRPPGWVARQREGSVELPGGLEVLVVEGVGASQPSVADLLDAVVWVETDEPTRLARDVVRVAAGEIGPEDYASWMAEENAYVTAHRPWERASVVVHGGTLLPHGDDEVVLASPIA
jgi:hypothetical protein